MADDIEERLDAIAEIIEKLPVPPKREYVDCVPANPNAGDVVYKTDENRLSVWTGSEWIPCSGTMEPVYEFGKSMPVAWIRRNEA